MTPHHLDGSVPEVEAARSDLLPKILLVDDEPLILNVTDQLLVLAGFEVTAVSSAEQAMVRLKTEPYDMVITDFRLGGKQGDAVVLAARNTSPATPVVLVTGLVDELPKWMREGHLALPIVAKPFRMHELLDALKSAMVGSGLSLAMPG